MPAALLDILDRLRPALSGLARPWWVIGSTAMALHRVAGIVVRDVDLLLDVADAALLCETHGFVPVADGSSDRFASEIYARRDDLRLPVEIMAGFRVRSGVGWTPVTPGPAVRMEGWPVASIADLIAMCRAFDRPKDRQRIALLNIHHR
jgi:hypothetical protein